MNTADIMDFKNVGPEPYSFIGNLALPLGKQVVATAKIYNKVGLFSVVSSQPVVVSPHPSLAVFDGYTIHVDSDFQPKLSMLGGSWKYSDPCQILLAEWAIEDIAGRIVQNFTKIPGNGLVFFNDEIQLSNGITYINIIRIKDGLNRTKTVMSNGITARIQPPSPGIVRDGLEDDIDYQGPTTYLSANWVGFGRRSNKDPTQKIVKYEVSIGNDRRYSKTRQNVHAFVDVGLNSSYTFTNLNLTAKFVTYYITVRATSEAGSSVIQTSDGVRVGFSGEMIPGKISYNKYQSNIHEVNVHWSHFITDFGIRRYEVGIGTSSPDYINVSFPCADLNKRVMNSFDIQKLNSVGDNTLFTMKNLTLQHGKSYYISVVAYDDAGVCALVTGEPLVIDTTPPTTGYILVENLNTSALIFSTRENTMFVAWPDAFDSESGIKTSTLTLYQKNSCGIKSRANKIQEVQISDAFEYTFLQLNLESNIPYFVLLEIENKAGLTSSITSYPIVIDTPPPIEGDIKPGRNWEVRNTYQNSTTRLDATIAVSHLSNKCERQEYKSTDSLILMDVPYTEHCTISNEKYAKVVVRHDDTLQKIIKGGFTSKQMQLMEGSYSFTMKPMTGEQVITVIALASEYDAIPLDIDRYLTVENASNVASKVQRNNTELGKNNLYGAGLLIPGYEQAENRNILIWALDLYGLRTQTIAMPKAQLSVFSYIDFTFTNASSSSRIAWNLDVSINGELQTAFSALTFAEELNMFFFGYTNNDYFPLVNDVFHPFYAEAELRQIAIPSKLESSCTKGAGFYDGESSVKEVWIGVSNSDNLTGNVVDLFPYTKYCNPCYSYCPEFCDINCKVSPDASISFISTFSICLFLLLPM